MLRVTVNCLEQRQQQEPVMLQKYVAQLIPRTELSSWRVYRSIEAPTGFFFVLLRSSSLSRDHLGE